MEFMRQMLVEKEMAKVEAILEKLEGTKEKIEKVIEKRQAKAISEGFIDDHNGPLEAQMDELARKFTVARKAVGLVNKLSDDPEKQTEHRKRIWAHLNQIRRELETAMSELGYDRNMQKMRKDHALADRESIDRRSQGGQSAMLRQPPRKGIWDRIRGR